MSILIVVIFAATLFSILGTCAGMAIMSKTTPDLRATAQQAASLLWHRVWAILVSTIILGVVGTLCFFISARVWTANFGPDLHPSTTTKVCTDHELPSWAVAKAVVNNVDYNNGNSAVQGTMPYTYQTCTTDTVSH